MPPPPDPDAAARRRREPAAEGARPTPGGLAAYRSKRSPGRTPEPFGGGPGRPRLFVVQQHAARRLHWDLRLEIGGVLKSWAVPKGPSADPQEKRLAVQTEDHPVEYGDFEGVIPAGSYGAGAMIVWDRGRWLPLEDPEAGLGRGKLLFELFGYKLRGVWTLVKTSRGDQEWLLIKKPDAWAAAEGSPPPSDESVLSGLTVGEVREGQRRGEEVRRALAAVGARRREVSAAAVKPMLAATSRRPFSRPGWLFELKYDGYRLLAERAAGRLRLVYRSGRDATAAFPDLARALAALPYEAFLLDGEVVVLDEAGRPDFQRLQRRAQLARSADVERAAVELPATLYLFDLLAFEGHDARRLPLARRKELLQRLLPRLGPLRYSDHVEERGLELFAEVRERGLEGLVAKRADSLYRAGRSRDWRKIPADRRGDFAVVGFTAPQGSRAGFGALHLAARRGGELVYAGRVGSGFSEPQLAAIAGRLAGRQRRRPACGGALPAGREHTWVEPELVAEVRYKQWTEEGLLRQPVFLRLREDKAVAECDPLPRPRGGEPAPAPEPPERGLELTNTDKVFWPDEGYTKGDLLAYYRAVAPWILPYLADRPVVLDRYPDGIAGKSFFQKNAPDYVPAWVRTARLWSEEPGEEVDFFVAGDLDSLLYLVNLGAIPLHIGAARVGSAQSPDWCILDLDPKGAPFRHVVRLARTIHELCQRLRLPCFVKTSGGSGLHLLLPLGGAATHDEAKLLGELLARLAVERLPDLATTARTIADRGGKVYVDFLQNGRGKLLVAPFSARPFPAAPVSTPLGWKEVNARLDPRRFTIRSVPRRMRRLKADPLAGVLDGRPDLGRALALLAEEVGRG